MVTERTIINALIIGASFIFVPFVISESMTVDNLPALFFFVLFVLTVAFFFLKDTLCLWPLLTGNMGWTMNFLPLPFAVYHIVCMLLIFYYVTGYVLIRQKPIKLGKVSFFWPIIIITLILLYHNHSLSVRFAGGDTEGAKPAFLIYLVVMAYICGINVKAPSTRFLSNIPLIFVAMTAVGSLPYLFTTVVPGAAPTIYAIFGNVNVDAYFESLRGSGTGGEDAAIGRLQVFGPLGMSFQLYMLCYYPIGTWLRPNRWWVIVLSLVCMVLVVSSGYRSMLFGYAAMFIVATMCYYSWRAVFLPLVVCVAGTLFILASSNGLIHMPEDKLPMIAQRTLSFLPGDWNKDAIDSGKASSEFRKNIQDVYIREYAEKSPLIGNGFNIDTKVFNTLSDILKYGGGGENNGYIQSKSFIEGKLFHTGWISVYDCVGIIGSLAFVILGWNEIRETGRFVFGPKTNRRSSLFPVYVWIFCNVATMMFTFFTVFGDFKDTFMNLCLYAIALSQLSDLEKTSDLPIPLREHKGQGELVGSKTSAYGYYSKR